MFADNDKQRLVEKKRKYRERRKKPMSKIVALSPNTDYHFNTSFTQENWLLFISN